MERDVWNGLFAPDSQLIDPIFVNTTVADEATGLLSNNWAVYPNADALMGFVQYVFLPTVFYFILGGETGRLMTPICSSTQFAAMVKGSASPHRRAMSAHLRRFSALWDMNEPDRPEMLQAFFAEFNRYWHRQSPLLHICAFRGAHAVGECLRKIIWSEDVFKEETGFTYEQFGALCSRFDSEAYAKHLLIRTLERRVGCLV